MTDREILDRLWEAYRETPFASFSLTRKLDLRPQEHTAVRLQFTRSVNVAAAFALSFSDFVSKYIMQNHTIHSPINQYDK